jgi:hypothetical protein
MTRTSMIDDAAETMTDADPDEMAIATTTAEMIPTMKITIDAAATDHRFHRLHRSKLASPMIPLPKLG